MIKWLHHLLNPHCEECIEEELVLRACKSCETYRLTLEQVTREKNQLFELILNFNKPSDVVHFTETTPEQAISPKNIPWRVRREMLEAEDRERAKVMRQNMNQSSGKSDIDKLEKELGLGDK